MKITPTINGDRVAISVKETEPLPRGRWQKILTLDMPNTKMHNKKIVLKGASCGLAGCYCDAKIVGVK